MSPCARGTGHAAARRRGQSRCAMWRAGRDAAVSTALTVPHSRVCARAAIGKPDAGAERTSIASSASGERRRLWKALSSGVSVNRARCKGDAKERSRHRLPAARGMSPSSMHAGAGAVRAVRAPRRADRQSGATRGKNAPLVPEHVRAPRMLCNLTTHDQPQMSALTPCHAARRHGVLSWAAHGHQQPCGGRNGRGGHAWVSPVCAQLANLPAPPLPSLSAAAWPGGWRFTGAAEAARQQSWRGDRRARRRRQPAACATPPPRRRG